jgi:ferredoxin
MTAPNCPEISIDSTKCTIPFHCKKCLVGCPQAVFRVYPIKVVKGQETNPEEPGAYGMGVGFQDKCTGCNDCINMCPEDAITIIF